MRLALALVLLATTAAAATTRTVAFPLVIDHPILEAALRRDLGMEEGASLELWGTPGDCHWAVLDDLAFTTDGGKLLLRFDGSTVAGFRLLWFCVSPFAWQGSLLMRTRPVVGRDWRLRFETLELEARDADGGPSPLTNSALQLMRGQLEARLHAFQFDLGPPIDEAKALIRAAVDPERAEPVLAALDTLRPLDTAVDGDGVRVEVAMDVPEGEGERVAEPALTDAEVAAWNERVDRWEAFLVFTVKILAGTTEDRAVRDELLAILLDGRRELVDVLRQGPVPGTDPVRGLFLSSWDRVRVQARRAIHSGALGDRTYRFVSFLAAGDALAAIDQAGPGLGLEISADGLRRLARLVDPDTRADPIPVTEKVDPELRTLFGFKDLGEETPPAPPSTTAPSTTAPPTEPPATTPPTSTTIPPPAEPTPTTIEPAPAPTSTLPLSWLWAPREAAAATVDLATLGTKLDRWVPGDDELRTYRDLVEQMLTAVAAHRLDRVDGRLRPTYRSLVPAVAWQESCWRQFVKRSDGTVTYLYSRTGDIGIMQVNRRVWRGFFDIAKLEWDAVYNAAAGAEILVQLLRRVGAKEADKSPDGAARATYSAYNAGPGAYARYRTAKAKSRGRAIDDDFYAKYRQSAAGTAGDLVLCMG